jgi:hypothetical protein
MVDEAAKTLAASDVADTDQQHDDDDEQTNGAETNGGGSLASSMHSSPQTSEAPVSKKSTAKK